MFVLGLILIFVMFVLWGGLDIENTTLYVILSIFSISFMAMDIASPMEEILSETYVSNKVIESNLELYSPKLIEVYDLKSTWPFCIIKNTSNHKIIIKDIENE